MSQGQSVSRIRTWASLAGMMAIVVSCSDAARSPLMPRDELQASPANNSGGPSVSAATPASGEQGVVSLQVTIDGSGFATGAVASWERNGVPDPKVTVKSTQFVSSKKVLAKIDIALDADTASYDVAVTNTDRKKGIGTALFAVTAYHGNQAPAIPIAMTVDDVGPLGAYGIQSDGKGEYVDGMQGMTVQITGAGDLLFSPLNGGTGIVPERTLKFDFSSPVDPNNTYRPDELTQQLNFKLLTNNSVAPNIQDLGINGNPASGCYQSSIAHSNGAMSYVAWFNPLAYPTTVYLYITRTSSNTWTMVSDGPCGGDPYRARLTSQELVTKGKTQPMVYRGDYYLPFSMHFRSL